MRFRKLIIEALYEIASAACQLADALAPTSDDIWRERRWKQFNADHAKSWDGPPLAAVDRSLAEDRCPMCGEPAPFADSLYCPKHTTEVMNARRN